MRAASTARPHRPYGIACLTGFGNRCRIGVDADGLNRELVLENDVVLGTVNANLRHYRQAADALTKADLSWVGSALVDVADQQVGAAGVALFADLGQDPGDRDVLGEALPDQVSVGVDQAGAVARRAQQFFGFVGAGVAFDRLQRPPQPSCAFQQPDTLGELGMHGGVPLVAACVQHGVRNARGGVPTGGAGNHAFLHRRS
ncbi:hypothetical protein [Actinophytocola sp.]|uniref:hypothetical protein n=1 Tax=Actinophytocola sp. TaxID=1872138 RepID=UPI0038999445